jgi:hypothetical protein
MAHLRVNSTDAFPFSNNVLLLKYVYITFDFNFNLSEISAQRYSADSLKKPDLSPPTIPS